MSVPPKWRGRVAAVNQALPGFTNPNGLPGVRPATALERGKIVRAYAHTDVPAEDIKGMSGLRMKESSGAAAAYSPFSRAMTVDPKTLAGTSPEKRGGLQRTLAHETGHHVQNMNLNGRQFPADQYAEATAENYADKHGGDLVGHRGVSKYDAITGAGFSPNGWSEDTGQSHAETVSAYQAHRAGGAMPHEPFSESVNGNREKMRDLGARAVRHALDNDKFDEYSQAGLSGYAKKYGL